ncbi:unnamed protein product [Discosporangium mesarthrocarpum]
MAASFVLRTITVSLFVLCCNGFMKPVSPLSAQVLSHRHSRIGGAYPTSTHPPSALAATPVVSLAAKGSNEEQAEGKATGIEPKYLAAAGVVVFGILYDFFVTHGGVAPWEQGGVW